MADGLTKWGARLYSRLPLLGGWLRQGAVRRLAEDDSPEAVRLLAEAVARTDDQAVRILALEALEEVDRPRCIEAICAAWAATRDAYLEELLTIRSWGEKAPPDVRVLYLLTKGREDELMSAGAEVVGPLLRACQDRDAQVATRARQALGRLQDGEAREALCRAVTDHDDPLAREVALAAGYAPRQAEPRALFYFLTEQWKAYDELDFDRSLLRAAYQAAKGPLRQRLAAKARQAGRVEWVEVVTGGRQSLRLGEMSDAEWQTILEVLVERQQWAECWRLAQEAPARWSARLLQRLAVADALKTDRAALDELVRLAAAWQEPDLSALLRRRASLKGAVNASRCFAVSPDSRLIASGIGEDVQLWDLSSGLALQTLKGHRAPVFCLAISPRGKVLVSGDIQGTVRVWNLPDGRPMQTYVRPWHQGEVSCLAISPNGKVAVSGGLDQTIRLWRLPDGLPLGSRTTAPEALVWSLAFSPDGQLFASGSERSVCVWGLPEGQLLRSLECVDAARSLIFSPDGRLMAGCGSDNAIHLWDISGGKNNFCLTEHVGRVNCLAITPDGRLLASGGRDNLVRLWELPEGRPLKTLAGHTDEVSSLAMSADGRVLASGSTDRTVELWGLPEGRPLTTLKGDMGRIHGLAFSLDGQALVAGSTAGNLELWVSELVRLSRIPAGTMSPRDVALAQAALGDSTLSATERAALEFLGALVRHRRRFDIHLDDGPRRIAVGEFDIEIAG